MLNEDLICSSTWNIPNSMAFLAISFFWMLICFIYCLLQTKVARINLYLHINTRSFPFSLETPYQLPIHFQLLNTDLQFQTAAYISNQDFVKQCLSKSLYNKLKALCLFSNIDKTHVSQMTTYCWIMLSVVAVVFSCGGAIIRNIQCVSKINF